MSSSDSSSSQDCTSRVDQVKSPRTDSDEDSQVTFEDQAGKCSPSQNDEVTRSPNNLHSTDPGKSKQNEIRPLEDGLYPSEKLSESSAEPAVTQTSQPEAGVSDYTTSSTCRKSERRAKAFARVRLVLAREQLIDDDNFLGFTNRKSYMPPKKRKKLCQFKAENSRIKPKFPKPSHSVPPALGSSNQNVKDSKTGEAEKVTEKDDDTSSVVKETVLAETELKQPTTEDGKEETDLPDMEWFCCNHCDYKTRNKYYIKRHEMTHKKPKILYECHYCDYVTKSVIRYKEHEAQHTQEKPFKCVHCSYSSRSNTDFRRHQAKHATEKKYKCPHCDFTTKWSRNVSHHILKHTTVRPHKCDICGFSFKRIQDLKYHLYRHNDVKPISCDSCDFKCKTNYELRCHKLKHSDERFFACNHPGCTQQTKTKSDLTKHMNVHNTEKKYICEICQKGFNAKCTLSKHVRIHGERELLKCDICQKYLKTRASLQGHLKLHQGHYPFSCDICHRRFAVKWNLIKHQETHILEDRPYRCPICPYGARTMEHLLTHIGSMHGKSYAYFCEICRKPFKRFGQLRIHMRRMHATALDNNTPSNMEAMLREIKPSTNGDDMGLNKDGHNEMEVKKEPLNIVEGVETEVLPEVKTEPQEAAISPETVPLPEIRIESVSTLSVPNTDGERQLTTRENYEDDDKTTAAALEQKPLATVGIYNGFTLPLATKGFEFNLEKRGKKPDSWFMDLKHMKGKAADKHKKYLYKKQHGLLSQRRPRLPKGCEEREAEKRRRKTEKYIISCRVSTKNETTLIFHTEKQKRKRKKSNSKPARDKSNTVAALLLKSVHSSSNEDKSVGVSEMKRKRRLVKKATVQSDTQDVAIPQDNSTNKSPNESATRITDTVASAESGLPNTLARASPPEYHLASIKSVSNAPVVGDAVHLGVIKRKRGRPKGSKNKKSRTNENAKVLLNGVQNGNGENPSPCKSNQTTGPGPKIKSAMMTEQATPKTTQLNGKLNHPASLAGPQKKKIVKRVRRRKKAEVLKHRKDSNGTADHLATVKKLSDIAGVEKKLPSTEHSSPISVAKESVSVAPVKRKPGRPKGSLNKKTLARLSAFEVSSDSTLAVISDTSSEAKLERPVRSLERKDPTRNTSEFVVSSHTSRLKTSSTNKDKCSEELCEEQSTLLPHPKGCVLDSSTIQTQYQPNIRQCSVSLEVLPKDPLKTMTETKADLKTPCETSVCSIKSEYPGNEAGSSTADPILSAHTTLDVDRTERMDGYNDIKTMVCIEETFSISDVETTKTVRKRRKPSKNEIKRKCRKKEGNSLVHKIPFENPRDGDIVRTTPEASVLQTETSNCQEARELSFKQEYTEVEVSNVSRDSTNLSNCAIKVEPLDEAIAFISADGTRSTHCQMKESQRNASPKRVGTPPVQPGTASLWDRFLPQETLTNRSENLSGDLSYGSHSIRRGHLSAVDVKDQIFDSEGFVTTGVKQELQYEDISDVETNIPL